jgi:hypothetical protein
MFIEFKRTFTRLQNVHLVQNKHSRIHGVFLKVLQGLKIYLKTIIKKGNNVHVDQKKSLR